MPEYDYFRKRIDELSRDIGEVAGKMRVHEEATRQIREDIAELRETIWFLAKIGGVGMVLLFLVEIGKATFPALFDLMIHR